MTDQRDAVVRNAADPRQVGRGQKWEKEQREREVFDLKVVLQDRAGRRLIWRLLGHCSVFGSVMATSGQIEYNSGRQDVGHWLLAEVIRADEDAYLLMQQEAYTDAKTKKAMVEATHTPTTEEQENG